MKIVFYFSVEGKTRMVTATGIGLALNLMAISEEELR
jgi:hypothetical protein